MQKKVLKTIESLFDELTETLNGIFLLRELSRHASDQVLGFGERLSSLIISNLFDNATLLDSREFIKTDDKFGNATVDQTLTEVTDKENHRI